MPASRLPRSRAGGSSSLGEPVTLKTAEHGSFQLAWEEFGRRAGSRACRTSLQSPLPGRSAARCSKLTNNPWVIRPALIKERLDVDRYTIVNDFGAVAYAVATLADEHFRHLCGPDEPLPKEGVISHRRARHRPRRCGAASQEGSDYEVIETEGGHIDFAPLDMLEDQILTQLRRHFRRVSVERVASRAGASGTSTKRSARSRASTSPSTTRRSCGRPRLPAPTASPLPRSTASASALARSPATWRSRRARMAVVIAGGRWPAPRRLSAALGLSRPLHRQGPVRAADGRNAGQAHHPSAAGPLRRRGGLCEGACMTIDEIMRTAPVIPVLVLEERDGLAGARRDLRRGRSAGARSHACARRSRSTPSGR